MLARVRDLTRQQGCGLSRDAGSASKALVEMTRIQDTGKDDPSQHILESQP